MRLSGFEPVVDGDCRVLVLGTMPGVASLQKQQYYGHPRNAFWPIMAALTEETLPEQYQARKLMLLRHGIALWDVIAECDIIGSSDSSIRNVVPNDLRQILETGKIQAIYANGGTAKRLYDRFQKDACQMEAIGLPSTSPANAAYSLERLTAQWRNII